MAYKYGDNFALYNHFVHQPKSILSMVGVGFLIETSLVLLQQFVYPASFEFVNYSTFTATYVVKFYLDLL